MGNQPVFVGSVGSSDTRVNTGNEKNRPPAPKHPLQNTAAAKAPAILREIRDLVSDVLAGKEEGAVQIDGALPDDLSSVSMNLTLDVPSEDYTLVRDEMRANGLQSREATDNGDGTVAISVKFNRQARRAMKRAQNGGTRTGLPREWQRRLKNIEQAIDDADSEQ